VTGTESLITSGKTKAARRVLLPSPRVRDALENRWKLDGEPGEGWVCAAETKDEHINQDSVKLQHKKALKLEKLRQFEVYSIRHTFLTGLGESGCDAWAASRESPDTRTSASLSVMFIRPRTPCRMHFPREWAQFWAQYRKYDFRKIWRVVAKHRYPRALDGERGRNRTYNLLIKSQLLCQLSYAPGPGTERESRGKVQPFDYSIGRRPCLTLPTRQTRAAHLRTS